MVKLAQYNALVPFDWLTARVLQLQYEVRAFPESISSVYLVSIFYIYTRTNNSFLELE